MSLWKFIVQIATNVQHSLTVSFRMIYSWFKDKVSRYLSFSSVLSCVYLHGSFRCKWVLLLQIKEILIFEEGINAQTSWPENWLSVTKSDKSNWREYQYRFSTIEKSIKHQQLSKNPIRQPFWFSFWPQFTYVITNI